MQCEICGRPLSEGKRVRLEGSVVVACDSCASCGEFVGVVRREVPVVPKRKAVADVVSGAGAGVPKALDLGIDAPELVEDYHLVVRRAREKKGFKQEDLARMLNEPLSLVHRIESGRYEPDKALLAKLRKALGVNLIDKPTGLFPGAPQGSASKEVTLGDIVVVKKKSREKK